ncbi:hypothetical protein [Mannheimia granulomatis]|uniref:hypothetical protein n=1 Tax=Mannheimia granulomatis TaxID=85402 RepID=UPI001F3B9358|nr:hypothetical protein [Mannheimia granulomatis]
MDITLSHNFLETDKQKHFYTSDELDLLNKNPIIAEQFYDAIKSEVDKLSYTADVYRLRKQKRNSHFKWEVSSKIPDRSGKCLYCRF